MVSKLIKVVIAALAVVTLSAAWPSSGIYPVYKGPCDLVTCAEAWSVTRAMKASYKGPLFQLNNGTTTLDIGQSPSRKTDMTTWSSFCSGVASNCTISKVYAQINTTSNDLTPFNSGTAHQAVFTIEAATGLPIWISQNAVVNQTSGQAYTVGGSSDNVSTGINSGGASETMLFNVAPIEQPNGWVGGLFGTDHAWNDPSCPPCAPGTDFGLMQGQGNANGHAGCNSSFTFCFGLEQELGSTVVNSPYPNPDYSVNRFPGAVMAASFDSGTQRVALYVNGFQEANPIQPCNAGSSPACTFAPGKRIHFGGGGDLTGPGIIQMREGLITNSALTQAQITNIFINTTLFYPGVNFPTPPNNPAVYASGPGDVVTGAKYFDGFRAYTAAIAAAGTQQLLSLENLTTTRNCGVLTNAAGGLGLTANCNSGGDNGQSVFSFCSSAGRNVGSDCAVTSVADQVGGVANYINIGTPNVLFVPYCINFLPCALFQGSPPGVLGANITLTSTPQPYTVVGVGERSSSTTAAGYLVTHETGNTFPGFTTAWNSSANSFFIQTTVAGTTFTATETDNVLHAFNFIFNGASSSIIVDGTSTSGTLGTDAAGANPGIRWGNSQSQGNFPLKGEILETGLYPFGFTGTQQANLRANQRAYWGF